MKIDGRSLAGTLSSPGQYFARWRKDPIYERTWKHDEKSVEESLYYRMKPKYQDMIREVFEQS